MESIHDTAERFGIERPVLEQFSYLEGSVEVVALTPDSEIAWANYLREIGLAKIAMNNC